MLEKEEPKSISGFSEEEFISKLRKGDADIVHLLYELYFVPLCDFCNCILNNSHDAEDIVSVIFERLLSRAHKRSRIGHSWVNMQDVCNYLYVAARFECFHYRNRRKTKMKHHALFAEGKFQEYDTNSALDFEFHKGLADHKLLGNVYTLTQRSVLVLRKLYLEDKSYDEIAEEMSISKATIGNLRQQGITILAKILNKEDYIGQLSLLMLSIGLVFISR